MSAFGVTRWIPSDLGIHLVAPKPLKILDFSGYPLTWVFISLHQKHSKSSTSQDTLSLGSPSRYTKSTQNPQLFRIPSHLGILLVAPKAPKILIIPWCMYAFEFRYRHPGYYDTSLKMAPKKKEHCNEVRSLIIKHY